MSEFEDILQDIGEFGPLQIQIFILVSLFETPAAWGILVHPVFAAVSPPWSCVVNDSSVVYENQTTPSHLAENCSLVNNGYCDSVQYDSDYSSIVVQWDLICDRAYITGLITVLQMVGVLIGACVTGQLADMYGRKKLLFAAYSTFLLFGIVSSFANSWILYMILRILTCAMFGGTMVVNFVLPLEFVGPKWRTFCGCIGFWACGVMSLALLAYLIPDWRLLTLTCFLLGLPLLATWWFIPESPRWLLLRGHQEEAERILTHIANKNKRPVPNFSKLHLFVQREQKKQERSRKYSYWDLFRGFRTSRTTLIVLYAWFVSSSVYYGTTLSVGKLSGNKYLNLFLLGLVEIPALIFVVLVNNRIGRRKTLAILMCISGGACFAVLILKLLEREDLVLAMTVFALLGKSGISGAWAAIQVSSAEVFPTVIRNIGIGASSMAARVGLIVAPELAALSLHYVFGIFGFFGVSCGFLCLLLPETLNHPLPDSLPPRSCCMCLESAEGDTEQHLVTVIDSAPSLDVTEKSANGQLLDTAVNSNDEVSKL